MGRIVVARPLVVELESALLRSDLAYERAFFKVAARFGSENSFDLAALPYDEDVLSLVRAARANGRPTFLLTQGSLDDANTIAAHHGLFDGVIAAPDQKAERLVAEFGEHGFDYVGGAASDVPVWVRAGTAHGARLDPKVRSRLLEARPDAQAQAAKAAGWRTWLKALRVHQYTKNMLIFVPMFTAHDLAPETAVAAIIAFIAFSLCASGVYIMNDLVDLPADRAHPTKRRRPFASGALPLAWGPPLAAALFLSSIMLAVLLPTRFLLCLIGYFVLTTAYSFWLKRKMAMDVVILALLYTTRILAGGFATYVVVSEWLIAFSTFIFTALALIKRYVELVGIHNRNLQDPRNRDYRRSDLPVIAALAAASAMNSVTIFALYLSSSAVVSAYSRPRALWLMCPLLLFWLLRALMLAHRGIIDDDPVVFALRDRTSWLTLACMSGVFLLAL